MTLQEAQAIYRQNFLGSAYYHAQETTFLRNLVSEKTSNALEISIEVSKGSRRVASDVLRGSEGTRNEAGRSTLRMYQPPFYHELIDLSAMAGYERMFGELSPSTGNFTAGQLDKLVEATGQKAGVLIDKINRAIALQVSQVLTERKVSLSNGDDIAYPADAGSVIDPSVKWDTAATATPIDDIEQACQFIAGRGLWGGGIFHLLLSGQAWKDLQASKQFKDKSDLRRVSLLDIQMPDFQPHGGVFHGEFAAGPYTVRVWTYPDTYDDADGNSKAYLPEGTATVLPISSNELYCHFAGIAQAVQDSQGNVVGFPVQEAKILQEEILDPYKRVHEIHIKSAPLVVPWMINRIANIKTRTATVVPTTK